MGTKIARKMQKAEMRTAHSHRGFKGFT